MIPVPKLETVKVPEVLICIRSMPLVERVKLPPDPLRPMSAPPTATEGDPAVPTGTTKGPVIVSPALRTFNEAWPVTVPTRLAVMVLALKLPEPSRVTIAELVFASVAVVAVLATLPPVVIVAKFESGNCVPASTSAASSKEVVNVPLRFVCKRPFAK